MRYVIGADGGGTKTALRAYVPDGAGLRPVSDRIVCEGINYNFGSVETAAARLVEGVRRACVPGGTLIAVGLVLLRNRMDLSWIAAAGMGATVLIQGYAAFQPMEINALMPALRSFWFNFHIGAAALSYSTFLVAACVAGRYVYQHRKGEPGDSLKMLQLEELSFRLTALGYLLLTVVIVIGAVWAEAAWSAYWTWDPKEVWALITWIIYTVYFHVRARKQKSGYWLCWYVILAVPAFLFTFAGVNKLIPGLHSYG